MKTVIFHREAEIEAAQAAVFYGEQQELLGSRFVVAIEEGLSRIRLNPFMFPVAEDDVSRCLIRSFPFAILFRVIDERIVIVAVMHLRRNPGYWKERN